jgi:hypothetical protein
MDQQEARTYLVALREKVDRHFEEAVARQPEAFTCGRGCASCCEQRFGVFELEARGIRDALTTMQTEDPERRALVRAQADSSEHAGICPFLVQGDCSVYSERPIICRSHGLPSPDQNGGVDVCPLNYRTSAPHPRSLLLPARVNEPLALVANLANDGNEPTRVSLEDLARAR